MKHNQFSKLKKAIRDNNKYAIMHFMMALPVLVRHPARARKAVTRSNYITNEINRALRALKQDGNWSPQLKEAYEVVKNRVGEQVWNEVIFKSPESSSSETEKTSETPTVSEPATS
jgi:hypothetical protein